MQMGECVESPRLKLEPRNTDNAVTAMITYRSEKEERGGGDLGIVVKRLPASLDTSKLPFG